MNVRRRLTESVARTVLTPWDPTTALVMMGTTWEMTVTLVKVSQHLELNININTHDNLK